MSSLKGGSGSQRLAVRAGTDEPIGANLRCCPICGGTGAKTWLHAPDRFHGRRASYALFRCDSCSLVWLEEPPSPQDMPTHYGEEYHRAIVGAGETGIAQRWHRHRDLILQEKPGGGAILDIGCSSGSFLNTMKDKNWNLYGIELEPATAEKAREKTGAEIFVGDVTDAPFPDEHFDVVTCFDLIEHVYDPGRLLLKVHAWLKPDGILYTVLPNIDSWEARLFGSYWYGLELPRHLFHFSPKSLRCAMDLLGFSEIRLETRTSYVERSVGYVWTEALRGAGFSPDPPSTASHHGLAWRATRKLLRVALVSPLAQVASIAGAAGSMEAIFAKRSSS